MKIKIQSKIGIIKMSIAKDFLPKTLCFKCGKEIYWAKGVSGKKIPISADGDDYIIHSLVCTFVLKYQAIKEKIKQSKVNSKFRK